MVNVRIRKKLFLKYLFNFILSFQRYQFCYNTILKPKVMIKLLRRAHSGFFLRITIFFANFSFLNFKIDLEFESIQK
jgi:hypothetical protein